ncbi:hypothetical protein IFT90_15660 [Frigoribacterium sp. CFBP 8766]|uniref:ParB family protein n=1 Tax=Frigoribacterium sp. CFBP 8766 TaxID=2775273 RepID=UPI001782FB05|nr:hypothetical protein [Frigoribacterium sp. CFBP 8766]MBD8585992.1 hypothetical protein [Frigoribacterium sp. CFBP 8766]
MTDSDNTRQIGGLQPRSSTQDLSRLLRRNRPAVEEGLPELPKAPESPPEDQAQKVVEKGSPTTGTQTSKTAGKPRVARKAPEPSVDSETKRMTVYIASRHYARARAAYRATSYASRDRSWSDFVEKAIVAELEKREAQFNAGEPYAPDPSPLSPGRPLSG